MRKTHNHLNSLKDNIMAKINPSFSQNHLNPITKEELLKTFEKIKEQTTKYESIKLKEMSK